MLPSFTEDHVIFRRSVAAFVAKEIAPFVAEFEGNGEVPRDIFKKLGALGYLGIRLSKEYDGSGQDFLYTTILLEELMRCGSVGVAVSIMAHAEFASKVIDRAGSPHLKECFVRPAITGEKIGALGITEPGAGSDVAAINTKALRDGDAYVINGTKVFITNGTIADFVTLAVRTGEKGHSGISLIVVPLDSSGIERRRLKKTMCDASDTAELFFTDVRVPAENLLGSEGDGFRLIMEGFEGERLVLSIIACAQMRLLFEAAKTQGLERAAFGNKLLGYQVWQHRLADVLTRITAAETLTYRAIDMYVRGVPANAEISMAKLFSTELAHRIAHDCSQIFGGMGLMEETAVARLERDCKGFTIGAGTSEMMRTIIAKSSGLAP